MNCSYVGMPISTERVSKSADQMLRGCSWTLTSTPRSGRPEEFSKAKAGPSSASWARDIIQPEANILLRPGSRSPQETLCRAPSLRCYLFELQDEDFNVHRLRTNNNHGEEPASTVATACLYAKPGQKSRRASPLPSATYYSCTQLLSPHKMIEIISSRTATRHALPASSDGS